MTSRLAYYRHEPRVQWSDDDFTELKAHEIGVFINDDNTVNITLAMFNTLMAQGGYKFIRTVASH